MIYVILTALKLTVWQENQTINKTKKGLNIVVDEV